MNVDPQKWVVSKNPLYSHLGLGIVQEVRGTQAKVEFRPTVFSKPPYRTESLFLDINDLTVVKTPLEKLHDREFDEPWRFFLKQRAAHLLVCNRDGQLSNARTDLLPHQITIAHMVVSNPRRRFLIADEVGLGKTIEAGMIIYALQQKGLANRVLVITPAGLTLQWQEEMKEKFDIDFAVYKEDVLGPHAFRSSDRIIASIDTLKRENHKELLLGAPNWSVIIFDEAHKLSAKTWSAKKTEKTHNYRLAEALKDYCDALLLLTATPHQGDESKFENLLGLLHPNVVFEEWAKKTESAVFYTELVLRNRKSKVCDAEGKPVFKGIDIHPVPVRLLDTGEKRFHKDLEGYLREGYGYADQEPADHQHKAIGFVMTTFQKLAASSTAAIKKALEKRRANLKREAEEEAGLEKGEYDARYQGEQEVREAEKVIDPFIETEVQLLDALISLVVPEDAKKTELLQVIDSVSKDNPEQLVLIFTEYLATQDFLEGVLQERYGNGCVTHIRGGMTLWEKKKSMGAFRDNPNVRFLVSTEAGGEGINLQFAHIMINYDLPWNPFRLAQRYGRLYRYGQDNVVQVFNLQNSDTIEAKVRQYLEKKTAHAAEKLAKLTGETTEEIEEGLLGLYDEFLDYEKIYREGLAKGNLKPSQVAINKGVKRAEEAYKLAFNSLFSKDITPFNPERFKHEIQSPLTLEDVKRFVSEFVKNNGRNFTKLPDDTWEFLLPQCLSGYPDLNKRYAKVTFERKRAIRHSELEFAAIGYPFTDAAIEHSGSVEFGGQSTCLSIAETQLADTHGAYFNFIVKLIKSTPDGEVINFDLVPVFVQHDGTINEEAGSIILNRDSGNSSDCTWGKDLNLNEIERVARDKVLADYEKKNVWDEHVICLNVALVEFA